jgi:glycerol-3-phosphate cytidylyltransferase
MTTKGYAAGAYDLFHVGHLNLLRRARESCDHLIAAVATDEFCAVTKGVRPVVPLAERMAIVSAIRYVDEVVVQEHEDRVAAHAVTPFDVFFKGSDWKGTPKGDALETSLATVGVEVVYFPYTEQTSSTKLREVLDVLLGAHPSHG